MQKRIAVIFLFAFCCKIAESQVTIIDSIWSGGQYRNYRLYIPAAYNGTEAVPLLLNLHGYSSDNYGQDLYANFRIIADTANFIEVLPNGTFDVLGFRYWNCFIAPGTGVDDVAFINDLLDSLSSNYLIDQNRIYSTGMSNGGFMSYTLAGELGNRIAAIASVAGTITNARFPAMHPTHNTPVMEIHGNADGTVPYDGGGLDFMPVDSVINYWVHFNHCNTTPTFTAVPDIVTTDDCTAEHYVYDGGYKNSRVELYKIIGGGHTWPGTALTFLGVTNLDINACKEIWWFLSQYRMDELMAINENIESDQQLKIYPNPVTNLLHIELEAAQPCSIAIFDMMGKCVLTSTLKMIDVHGLSAGTYFIKALGNGTIETAMFTKALN